MSRERFFVCERVSGVEPPSHPWQGRIMTTIRHPQLFCVPRKGIEPSTTAFSEQCSTTELPWHKSILTYCGRYRTRTYDPLSVNEMLYQLS